MTSPWSMIAAEARGAYRTANGFPFPAYSEYMPPPYVGCKPTDGRLAMPAVGDDQFAISEYEQAFEIEPGLATIARHIGSAVGRLMTGKPHGLSSTLLAANPAWPDELAAAAREGKLSHDPGIAMCSLALSRSQDDKGRSRWTLFGASHDGAAPAMLDGLDEAKLTALLVAVGAIADPSARWEILADDVPAALAGRRYRGQLGELAAVVTWQPFATLPAALRAAYLANTVRLVPSPASLVWHEHPRYRALAAELPRARQIPLLHLFPHLEQCAIRIPQSGWLDEQTTAVDKKIVNHIARQHRWQRVARDAELSASDPQAYRDRASIALFATTPEAIDLYNKPLARNSQIWTDDYRLVLDGPIADRAAIARAAAVVDRGGRFGYRMYYPPMRAGVRELFWHVPLVARSDGTRIAHPAAGYVTAEHIERKPGSPLRLSPQLLARADHRAAARTFPNDPGRARATTSHNLRKLLEAREFLDRPLPASYARALLDVAKATTLEGWLDDLAGGSSDRNSAKQLVSQLRGQLTTAAPGAPLVLDRLGTRAFEEQVWTTIRSLAHGEFTMKNDADAIAVNRGKHGGPAARAAHTQVHPRRDLEALGDWLHARYRDAIARHGMIGRAEVVDHVFQWESDHQFPWMEGWVKNQHAPAERNIVLMIPGRDRGEAVIMADHYDTAYMEDVFYAEKGGDALRAPAAGADDNHSATTALLLAAEQLLPLAAAGKLARDVWLIHLTGEEYPADCMGARAVARGVVEHTLTFTGEDGRPRPVGDVTIVGAFVLDMIGHNTERERDVFMIAPGEGAGSARLSLIAHRATERWNRCAEQWNRAPERTGLARAERVADRRTPSPPPPPFAHLTVRGEVRVEWEARSALFNTDGQIFSDIGVPCVLFMENYDISRTGYHDTHDTMANIDLDYCAAITAIAIETVAIAACDDAG